MYDASWLHDLFVRGQSGLGQALPLPLRVSLSRALSFLRPNTSKRLLRRLLKTMLMQNFWWQIRCIMGDVQVAYGFCFRTVQFEARAAMHQATNTQARHEPLHSL